MEGYGNLLDMGVHMLQLYILWLALLLVKTSYSESNRRLLAESERLWEQLSLAVCIVTEYIFPGAMAGGEEGGIWDEH